MKMFPSVDVLGFTLRREQFLYHSRSGTTGKKQTLFFALILRAVDSPIQNITN